MTTNRPRAEPVPGPCNSTAVIHSVDNAKDLPSRSLYAAQLLIGAVRDGNADGVAHILNDLDRHQLTSLAVTLAALVPYDQSLRELLAWNDDLWDRRKPRRKCRPHGTHAAFARHKKRGEQPCDDCVQGERLFQHARGPRRSIAPTAKEATV